ncbi:MAG TPA: hypothetical protein VMT96_01030 [Candidatus Bathyarchaeia archaeon]|nr:hypothetical protein [Candidatus Bathyarchaeia archaeon]
MGELLNPDARVSAQVNEVLSQNLSAEQEAVQQMLNLARVNDEIDML